MFVAGWRKPPVRSKKSPKTIKPQRGGMLFYFLNSAKWCGGEIKTIYIIQLHIKTESNRKHMKTTTIAVFTALVMLAGGSLLPLRAQGMHDDGQDERKPMQKIQQFKKMELLDRLNLDEATSDKFLVKYDKWEKELMELNHQRSILVQELHLSMEKKSGDEELNSELDSLIDLTSKVDKTRHDMYVDLRSILTAKQAANLALFEAQFQKRLSNSLNKMQHRGNGGGNGGDHNWQER